MATITLTIPNAVAQRVLDGVSSKYGYSATLADGSANPQTKSEFVKAWLSKVLKDAVRDYEADTAAANAAIAAANSVESNIAIT